MDDLVIPAGPGIRSGLTIPGTELVERFSRSSGPGGQSVNTSDTRVELRWDIAASSIPVVIRERLHGRLGDRLVNGVLAIVASEHRSQLQNRLAARERLADTVRDALRPPPPPRRPTKPSKAARQRRLDTKRHRGQIKSGRGRIPPE